MPPQVKDIKRLSEKIKHDYDGNFNRAFDVGRFTILCDNETKLRTAVEVIKKADKFNLTVSKDKDFFGRQSETHYRIHNIKLYIPKHNIYVEIQATLKQFTTLEGYTTFEGHIRSIDTIQFSPDGSKLISYFNDKKIPVWDISSGKQLFLLEGHEDNINEVQFSPDGTTIASGSSDKTIRLWDALTGKQIQILKDYSKNIRKIIFSSDGSKIMSYSDDKTIRIWDVSLGKQIQVLEGHNGSIDCIHLLPDGSKLVSCSRGKTIRLWGSDNGKIVDVTEASVVKCVWRVGIQSGLSMEDSIWKSIRGLKDEQTLLVKQRGGIF
ncbi:hypothetical protein RFI_31460 [Reticulomyxa filosa]|uniref:Uncharacterized protein n=1 Tax=Reticulomyxa filosa TaxID=46433 RepID=X6LXS5_RETFI|nr:hypothetical protein RFI_31460 [Reticulomyxa filosa]|eukprot:ETO05937.1 hypothetical protein RFI_31460 [Reticulomyxa filosa]